MTVARQEFVVRGMHCNSCAMSIDWELEDVDGVVEARTVYHKGVTEVTFDPARVAVADLVAAIAKAGYEAEVR